MSSGNFRNHSPNLTSVIKCIRICRVLQLVVGSGMTIAVASAQYDPGQELNHKLREDTHGVFALTFEERTRWEEKYGVNFGKAVNQQDMLSRIRIGAQIRANASPKHVPARIIQVSDIPRTKSGKIVELAVRNVVHGNPVRNLEALANPEALEHFRDRPELRG